MLIFYVEHACYAIKVQKEYKVGILYRSIYIILNYLFPTLYTTFVTNFRVSKLSKHTD